MMSDYSQLDLEIIKEFFSLMHYLTSNFNLLHTNINWSSLKKKNLIIESEYDKIYLSLINDKLVEKYKSFHIIVFLTKDNYKKQSKN